MERKNFAVLCAAVLCFWLFALALGTAEGVGLRAVMHPEDILAINAAQVDFAGFVFASGRHHVTLEQAVALRKLLHPDIQPVGVFVQDRKSVV